MLKEKDESLEIILYNVETLGIKVISYTSNYFPILMTLYEKLMKEEKVFYIVAFTFTSTKYFKLV
jgi:glutamyl/glutaminyl-tRNA synthetase